MYSYAVSVNKVTFTRTKKAGPQFGPREFAVGPIWPSFALQLALLSFLRLATLS